MKKLDKILHSVLCWACGILMFAMMAITFSQVVARYGFGSSLMWSEEAGRYIFVWIAFLGLVVAFNTGSHVALDLLVKVLSGVSRKTLELVNGALVSVFAIALLAGGMKLYHLGARQKSPAFELPMYYVYTVVPLSGALLLYFSLRALWTHYHEKPVDAIPAVEEKEG